MTADDEKMAAARDVVRELSRQEERRLRGYDPGCADLAQYFLVDEPALKERAGELARHIQQAIEDWIEGARQEAEADAERHP